MKQIKVEVSLVATDACYDFLLPLERTVSELLAEMTEQIEYVDKTVVLSKGGQLILCDMDRRFVLDPTKSLSELGVRNGARLTIC